MPPLKPCPHPAGLSRRHATLGLLAAGFGPWSANAQTPSAWRAIEAQARGQTVYFNAWAGSPTINSYLQWVGTQVQQGFGIRLEHVKISDAAEVVKRIRGEKSAGKLQNGSVDMLWINGENFLTLKREGLLFGPFATNLPNFAYVDVQGKPTTVQDFSEPTEGFEAPWGMAQLTFFCDSQKVPKPPQSMAELLAFAQSHPGRVSYPRLPDFHGTTFIKQALLELSPDRQALYQGVTADTFVRATAPLWTYLDALHPHLWRAGRQFVQSAAAMRQMLADGELLLAFSFNPNEAASEIAANRLPSSVTSYQFVAGTIGNTHFVAIPFNARAQAGAQVVANFLLGAQAQARKADLRYWGDPTVLDLARLPAAERAQFAAPNAPGLVQHTRPTLPEPHGSWVDPLEKAWLKRYGQ